MKGGLIHVDLQEVRLDQPIQARGRRRADRRARRRDGGRRALAGRARGHRRGAADGGSRAPRARRDRNGDRRHAAPRRPRHAGGRHLPRRPRGDRARDRHDADAHRRARARRGRGRRGRGGRAARGRGAGGRGGRRGCAELRTSPAGTPPASPKPPRARCASSVGASAPRRSTCSSRGSATRAASTSGRATTSAGSSLDELARRHGGSWRSKFSGSSPRCGSADARLALLKPETYMNESGRSVGAAARFFKVEPSQLLVVHDDVDLEPGRLQARRGRRARGPQRAALDRAAPRLAGLPAPAHRRGAARPRRPASRRGLRALAVRPRKRTSTRWSRVAPTRSSRSCAEGLEAAQARFN